MLVGCIVVEVVGAHGSLNRNLDDGSEGLRIEGAEGGIGRDEGRRRE